MQSVWRSILENFRPAAVWITDLLLFYIFTAGTFGEAWTVWSWLEASGWVPHAIPYTQSSFRGTL